MPAQLQKPGFPAIAATTIADRMPVKLDTTVAQRGVAPCGTAGDRPFGFVQTGASSTEPVAVRMPGEVAKAVAAASLGAGANLAIASTNGALGVAAGASGAVRFEVGQSLEAALPGETFAFYVNPRQISGLV